MTSRAIYLQAKIAGNLVRVHCADRVDGWVEGFIAGVGRDFFALEVVEGSACLNGFSCMRFDDITKIEIPAPHSKFIVKTLELKKIVRSEEPDLNLWSLQGLLESGARLFPLTSLFIQRKDGELSDFCYIGKIISVSNSEVTIACIDPNAKWYDDHDTYPLDLIYRVDYGDEYAKALFLVSSADP
jgi:hypothetical protein